MLSAELPKQFFSFNLMLRFKVFLADWPLSCSNFSLLQLNDVFIYSANILTDSAKHEQIVVCMLSMREPIVVELSTKLKEGV